MFQKIKLRYVFAATLLTALVVGVGDGYTEDMIVKGDALWRQRDTIGKAREAVAAWEAAAKADNRNPELWVKIARGYFWIGELTPESDKKARMLLYEKGIKASEKGLAIDPNHVGANFWQMVLQGRYTESKGLLSGFDLGNAINRTIVVTNNDIRYYNGGVYRYWGRVVYSVPSVMARFFKSDLDDAVDMYEEALKISPYFFETQLYIAETYIKMKDMEKARKILEWVVKADPEKMPDYAPENRFYQKKAEALLENNFGN